MKNSIVLVCVLVASALIAISLVTSGERLSRSVCAAGNNTTPKSSSVEFGSALKLNRGGEDVLRSDSIWPSSNGAALGEPTVPMRWHLYATSVDATDAITVEGERVATVADLRRWTDNAAVVVFVCSFLGVLAAFGFGALIRRVQISRYLARQRREGDGPYRGQP